MDKNEKNVQEDLLVHMKARYSILAAQTHEEARIMRLINEIGTDPKKFGTQPRKVMVASITKGLYEYDNEKTPEDGSGIDPVWLLGEIEKAQSEKTPAQTIYMLLDFGVFLNADGATGAPMRRKIRDLHTLLKSKASTIIMIDSLTEIPPELQKVITVFELPLPDKKELEEILCARVEKLKGQVSSTRQKLKDKPEHAVALQEELDKLVPMSEDIFKQVKENKDLIISALQGLTSIEADNVIAKNIVLKNISIPTILQEKKQIVKKSGALDYWETDETQESIGGLKLLKAWSRSAKNRWTKQALDYGLSQPKGAVLVGAPGTGKTLSAKAMANLFGVPLLTLTMAKMTSKYFGETGNRMIAAIQLAQAMSPCIVMIDEIDKALGTGGNQEHEESARTRGALLTAMEESKGIFWLGTCNQPESLAPELLARFPAIFHVDLPAPDERAEIFAIHLKKLKRDPKNFDIPLLVAKSDGYVGREIRDALQEAGGTAFDTKDKDGKPTEITTEHIIAAMKNITPTATRSKATIDRIRKWCKDNARPASEQAELSAATTTKEDIMNRDLEMFVPETR